MFRTDVYEIGDALVIEMEVPGFHSSSIEFVVDSTLLCVQFRRPDPEADAARAYYRRQRTPAALYESVPLPVSVRPQDVDAILEDGVLKIHLPIEKSAYEMIQYRLPLSSDRTLFRSAERCAKHQDGNPSVTARVALNGEPACA